MKKLFMFTIAALVLVTFSACKSNKEMLSEISVNSDVVMSSDADTTSDISSEETTTSAESTSSESEIQSQSSATSMVASSATSSSSASTPVDDAVSNVVEDKKEIVSDITENIIPDINPILPDNNSSENSSNNSSNDTSSDNTEIVPIISADELFYFGSVSDNIYENRFLGIGCNFGADWTVTSDAEIKEMNGIEQDATEQEISDHILNSFILIDMIAANNNGESAVMVLTMSDFGYGDFAALDMEEFMNTYLVSVEDNMVATGYENLYAERTTVTISGNEFYAIYATGSLEGETTHQTVFCVQDGAYLTLIEVTALDIAEMQAILNLFYIPV